MDPENKDIVKDVKKMREENNNEDRAESKEHLVSQNNDHDHRTTQLMNQVFENEILRENILTKVNQNDDLYKSIGSIRLVQKTWAKEVVRIMRKIGKPLYKLELNKDNSLNSSTYVEQNGSKILDHFIRTVALSTSRMENVVPPFKVMIKPDFFQDENRQSFSDFLTGGSVAGLVDLEIDIPKKGGSMDFVFSEKTPTFQILDRLTVRFCENETTEDHESLIHGSSSYFLPLIQSVFLLGANNLKELSLTSTEITSRFVDIPAGIKYLTLPQTITKLNLDCLLTNAQLEGLTTNCLPNLTNLSIPIYFIPITNSLMFRIFDQYKKTLRQLCLYGAYYDDQDIPKDATLFRFPVMERLETFDTSSIHAELESGLHSLQKYLPVLNNLSLTTQTAEMLRKWTDNSYFPTVTELDVSLVDDNVPQHRNNFEVTFRLEEMQVLHKTFPNVSVLEISVVGGETCGLKYMFMEMMQLRKLTIRVCRSEQFVDSNHWDSLLTGIPLSVAKTLSDNPQFWECIKYIEIKEDGSSLKNLNALRSLRLVAPFPTMADQSHQSSLISDSSFHLAFFKMPNLKTLLLEGKFKESLKMGLYWEAENRSIMYEPTVREY